jgi:hypothetical protein
MFNSYFYHAKYRKAVSIFGTMFNNINIIRTDANGDTISQVKVPISYAPRRKFLERLRQNADLDNDTKIAIKLPRMGFEIVGLSYDPNRQLPRVNSFPLQGATTGVKNKVYTATPYALQVSLSIYAKTQDDALQVVEQILPYFNPNYTIAIKPYAEYSSFIEDIPITLQSVQQEDDYEGTLEARRTIIYTLDFEMKVQFHGPLESGKIIKKAITKFHTMDNDLNDSDALYAIHELTTDPVSVDPDSDYSFVDTWTFAVDSA